MARKEFINPSPSDFSDDKNMPFNILNSDSNLNYFYKLNAPFQITYEYCSGSEKDDYLNILSLSEKGTSFFQETMKLHNYFFRNRPPHFHDFYEFLIVIEGSLIQQIEGKEYLYSQGCSCCINRNLFHREAFLQPTKVLFLGFSAEFIMNLLNIGGLAYFTEENQIRETLLYDFIANDINSPGRKAYLDFIPTLHNAAPQNYLHKLTEDLITTILFPRFGSTYMLNGLLCSILQYITDPKSYHCTCAELSNNSDYLLFSRVEHLLDENDGRITRSELSQKLNYSGDYLNRIINKYTGMSLHTYGMEFCMKKAAYYLSSTNESVSSIMAKLSFSNRTYFYKLFQDQYGMTPREYRQKMSNTL
ncbi:MAG: AraC family transcriptional regulator [Ruminococcus sp.]|nr:AraC family transcriptional regulator [Ruminococcus sp.]